MALTKVTGHVIKSDTNITSHNINSSGIITAITFDGNVSGVAVTFTGDSTIGSLGITTNLNVGGISTFTGNIDANGSLDVDGHTELDNLRVSGVSTLTGRIFAGGTSIPGYTGADDLTIGSESGNHGITIRSSNTGGGGLFFSYATSPGDNSTQWAGGLEYNHSSGELRFYQGGTVRGMFRGSGDFTPWLDSTGALGTTSRRWSNLHADAATIAGNATISGNLTVDGVLTYQDVTNIDSIGIVTARSDIRGGRNLSVVGIITANQIKFADSNFGASTNQLRFGSSDDMLIYHDGNNSVIKNQTNDLYIESVGSGDDIIIKSADDLLLQVAGTEDGIKIIGDGAVELYHNGIKQIETVSSGVLLPDMSTNKGRIAFGDLGTRIEGGAGAGADDGIHFMTNSVARWQMNPDGDLIPNTAGAVDIGSASVGIGSVFLPDDKRIAIGNDQDLQISHSAGVNFFVSPTNRQTQHKTDGGFLIRGGGNQMIANFLESAVTLYKSQQIRLTTTSSGITVGGEVAASQEYPLTKPVLDFNFAAEKKLDPRIQFTRSSIATFIDKKGIVRYASDNQPRFDHHPTSGVSLGLLLEQQSINYQPYSVDMSQGSGNNGVTVENNAAIAPDGTMTASKITGGTNQNTSQRLGWGTQGVASNSYTMWSIWLKSEETSCIIQIYSNTYTFGADVITVELADGTMGGHSGEFGDTTFRYNLEKYPNKWWRLSWGGNGNAGGNSGGMYVAVVPAMNSARAANTGSAHSKVWYAWGLQEEVGTQRKFASSYIPTNGAAVTRAADRGTIDGDDFNDFFDRYQGAVVHETSNAILSWTQGGCGWEFNNDNYQYNVISNLGGGYSHNAYPGGYAVIHGENSDSGTNSMSQFSSSSATGNQGFNNGYYAGRYPSTSVVDYNRLYKTYTDGMSWDISGSTNTLIAATGGFSETGTNTNNISHRNISKFELGSDATDMDGSYQKFSGRIKRWIYYDKALTANQLENVTAQDPVTYL